MVTAETQKGNEVLSKGSFVEHPRGAWLELKMINGCGPYAYLRWRENGRCRSKYIGKVKPPDEGT